MSTTLGGSNPYQLGYARAGGDRYSLEAQIDALTNVGVEPARIYSDKTTAASASTDRPGWAALLAYARPGDTTVIAGIDRLGRSGPEVLASALELSRRRIGLRSLREGLDTSDPVGAMIVGVLSSLAELDEEVGARQARSTVGRSHATSVGRPRALSAAQVDVAEQMKAAGRSVPQIATELGVSRATLYRTLAERRATR
ncbi:recombinase family protein [Gordonia hydrophobica]|uniref:Recombinase family protein n=1 Tax=Gordonia hydrophobica TaxID=40516 RepID=A0ABZ2U1Y8_9ACTN|nr:recombinase family protein [Gordonia hydrophobica]MBM7369445.1 DNA invertase Pin-like site-specific DNA recombinase [Gordonia hydrophobica]